MMEQNEDRIFCSNDEVFCRCRSCLSSMVNGGSCMHCLCCMDGEKAEDVCKEYRSINGRTGYPDDRIL